MINFHKFGFLDVQKLQRYIQDKNYWVYQMNPIWLFLWSEYYKPEIAYYQELCYIRLYIRDVGVCYYAPLGMGDLSIPLKQIEKDCVDSGYDLNLAMVPEETASTLNSLGYSLKLNDDLSRKIYTTESFAYCHGLRGKQNLIKRFERENKKVFYRKLKKEDFPKILEFIEQSQSLPKDDLYFHRLNMIRLAMDHLYELNLLSIMLCDEEKIYGIAMANIQENMTYVHVCLSVEGALEELLMCLSKEAMRSAKYIIFDKEVESKLNGYPSFWQESVYSTFLL